MTNKTCPGMLLYYDDMESLYRLEDAQLGALIRAMARYGREGVMPKLEDPMTEMAFSMLRFKLDRDRAHYAEVSDRRSRAAQKSHMQRGQQMQQMQPTETETVTETESETEKETETEAGTEAVNAAPRWEGASFSPPAPEEVRDYAAEMGYAGFNAETFVNYYAANGWMVGRNPMKDWRAAVRSWHTRDKPPIPAMAIQKEYGEFNPLTDW